LVGNHSACRISGSATRPHPYLQRPPHEHGLCRFTTAFPEYGNFGQGKCAEEFSGVLEREEETC